MFFFLLETFFLLTDNYFYAFVKTEQKFFVRLINNEHSIESNEPFSYKGLLCGRNIEKIIHFCKIETNLLTAVLPSKWLKCAF
jgi:hypothetical protein